MANYSAEEIEQIRRGFIEAGNVAGIDNTQYLRTHKSPIREEQMPLYGCKRDGLSPLERKVLQQQRGQQRPAVWDEDVKEV